MRDAVKEEEEREREQKMWNYQYEGREKRRRFSLGKRSDSSCYFETVEWNRIVVLFTRLNQWVEWNNSLKCSRRRTWTTNIKWNEFAEITIQRYIYCVNNCNKHTTTTRNGYGEWKERFFGNVLINCRRQRKGRFRRRFHMTQIEKEIEEW